MDGMSDWPGEPCDTSIPNIIVGTFETKGMFRDCSIANKEFKPPSYPDEKNFGMLEKKLHLLWVSRKERKNISNDQYWYAISP